MTRHAYLPTTLITVKGTAFTSRLLEEVETILDIQNKCATMTHPQTKGKLKRTHASLKGNLKKASGEYRRQWHKYLLLAVLNYNTTYHSSIGCEPSRIFHGRVPYNLLDHRLGLNPNPKILPTTDFAEKLQRCTQTLIDKTKKKIMQSYLKFKVYYDRKARAAPPTTGRLLQQGDYCFILQPLADHQGSKTSFRDFRWIGPYVIEKVLLNDNYIVRKLSSNKTQSLHCIRLRKYTPSTEIREVRPEGNLQADDETIIPQDDLCIFSWDTEFDDLPQNSETKNASDDSPMISDQQDTIITDLVLRSTRRDENTNDTATERREHELNDAELQSTRPQHDTSSTESEQLPEQPAENTADKDLRSIRPQSSTDSEIDENTSTSPPEAGNPDYSNLEGQIQSCPIY